jgi:hypothetical protein
MELVLGWEKETKNKIRFGDGDTHELYFTKAEVNALGNPKHLLVKIEPMTEAKTESV